MSGQGAKVASVPPERMPVAWMAARSEAFIRATQGRGKPSIYGTGKVPEKKGSKS